MWARRVSVGIEERRRPVRSRISLRSVAEKLAEAELPGTNRVPDVKRTSVTTSKRTGKLLHESIIWYFGWNDMPVYPHRSSAFSRDP